MEPSSRQWTTVTTTLPRVPYPAPSTREATTTQHLVLRGFTPDDLSALHNICSQPEVAIWSSTGKPNTLIEQTRHELHEALSTDKYMFAICLRSTGELIGMGGSHRRQGSLGWPVISYTLRHEVWGNGYGTEFLAAFLALWWELPREVLQVVAEKDTISHEIDGGTEELVAELITATTRDKNFASQKVMLKNGMSLAKVYLENDRTCEGQYTTWFGYIAKAPRPSI